VCQPDRACVRDGRAAAAAPGPPGARRGALAGGHGRLPLPERSVRGAGARPPVILSTPPATPDTPAPRESISALPQFF